MKKLMIYLFGIVLLGTACYPTEAQELLSPKEFQAKIDKDTDAQVVDVRTAQEYNSGHVKGAICIDYYDKDFRNLAKKNLDKTKWVYIYCKRGSRSARANAILKDLGFRVIELQGGIMNWLTQGLPVE